MCCVLRELFDLEQIHDNSGTNFNKKQCSRQLQCEVPCGTGNVINSFLFINSSLSSLSSTNHAVHQDGGGSSCRGGLRQGEGGWGRGKGAGDISIQLPYTALSHGASPKRDFAQQRLSTTKSAQKAVREHGCLTRLRHACKTDINFSNQ